MTGREILYEMRRIGNVVKVTAIDCVTGTEASIQGPANAPATLLRQNACRKLEYVLAKQKAK